MEVELLVYIKLSWVDNMCGFFLDKSILGKKRYFDMWIYVWCLFIMVFLFYEILFFLEFGKNFFFFIIIYKCRVLIELVNIKDMLILSFNCVILNMIVFVF